jgi:hypothetical protein
VAEESQRQSDQSAGGGREMGVSERWVHKLLSVSDCARHRAQAAMRQQRLRVDIRLDGKLKSRSEGRYFQYRGVRWAGSCC